MLNGISIARPLIELFVQSVVATIAMVALFGNNYSNGFYPISLTIYQDYVAIVAFLFGSGYFFTYLIAHIFLKTSNLIRLTISVSIFLIHSIFFQLVLIGDRVSLWPLIFFGVFIVLISNIIGNYFSNRAT